MLIFFPYDEPSSRPASFHRASLWRFQTWSEEIGLACSTSELSLVPSLELCVHPCILYGEYYVYSRAKLACVAFPTPLRTVLVAGCRCKQQQQQQRPMQRERLDDGTGQVGTHPPTAHSNHGRDVNKLKLAGRSWSWKLLEPIYLLPFHCSPPVQARHRQPPTHGQLQSCLSTICSRATYRLFGNRSCYG